MADEYGLYKWPAADFLVKFIEDNRSIFEGKSVLELGAGIHGTCGKCAARMGATPVTITDGLVTGPGISTLLYGQAAPEQYDIIIGSDIYYRWIKLDDVLFTIRNSLKVGGACYLALQERTGDWAQFLTRCKVLRVHTDVDPSEYAEPIHTSIGDEIYILKLNILSPEH